LSFLGVYTKLKAFIPSSINETDFNNNPQNQQPTGLAKDLNPMISPFGIGYEQELGNRWVLKSSVFTNYKKAFEPRPFDILDDRLQWAYALL
jgi:iron complex outermembrane receptor protein